MGIEPFDLSGIQKYHQGVLQKALDGPECILCLDRSMDTLLKGILETSDLSKGLPSNVKSVHYTDEGKFNCAKGAKV